MRIRLDCERVLVTLLRGLGPWKESVYLVGGLTPRYLVPARPPEVPPHAEHARRRHRHRATDPGRHRRVSHAVRKICAGWGSSGRRTPAARRSPGAGRTVPNEAHRLYSNCWRMQPEIAGGKVQPLPMVGQISALNIPHASIVFDLHQLTEIQAELLDDAGVATEQIKHANLSELHLSEGVCVR